MWIILQFDVFLHVAHNYVWENDIASCLVFEFFVDNIFTNLEQPFELDFWII